MNNRINEVGKMIKALRVTMIEAEAAIFFGLKVLVEREETARALSDMAGKMRTTAQVHLEVDTGLARFGVMPDGATEMAKRVATLPNLIVASNTGRAGHRRTPRRGLPDAQPT